MPNTIYETVIDSNFVMAYDTYNQQLADEERVLARSRRNEPINDQPKDFLPAPPTAIDRASQPFDRSPLPPINEHSEKEIPWNKISFQPKSTQCVVESPVMPSAARSLVTAMLIGYTTALLMYCLSSCGSDDGNQRREAVSR